MWILSAVFAAVVVAVFALRGVAEGAGVTMAFAPLLIVALTTEVTWRGRDLNEHPIFVEADLRKIVEATVKLAFVEFFGLVIGGVVQAVPKLPYGASGAGFIVGTLVGITAWTLCAEVLVTIARGKRLEDEAPSDDATGAGAP